MADKLLTKRQASTPSGGSPVPKMMKKGAGKFTLDDLSNPPSKDELSRYEDMPLERLPQKYKRQTDQRVFCNRSVDMHKIRYLGFDMDYTLCEYNSPATEELTYTLIVDQLIEMGYSEEFRKFRYRPDFPIRGLIIDRAHGNIIKTDAYGHILSVYHGHHRLQSDATRKVWCCKHPLYPVPSALLHLLTPHCWFVALPYSIPSLP
eukprot:m.53647 g.53647  ORF g.53647 m.53647 type:complete len:205 (+) comp13575_c0_seq3:217-831(+)